MFTLFKQAKHMKTFFRSVEFAIKGIRSALKGRNFVIQCSIAILVLGMGLFLGLSSTDWCIVLLTIALVLSMEIVNSAIENIVNFISPEYHPLAGKIKDLAAGAVLVVSIFAAIIGMVIFIKYFSSL